MGRRIFSMVLILLLLVGCEAATPSATEIASTPLAATATAEFTPLPPATAVPESPADGSQAPFSSTSATGDSAGDTLLLVFGNRFINTIYTTLRPILEEAGYTVHVASRTQGPLPAKAGSLEVDVDLLLDDVQVEDYAAVVFLCDNDITNGSTRDATNRIVQEAVAQSKVLAAICSGPRVLAYADVVDGLTLTGEPSQTCQLLEQGGATCSGRNLERDGLIITAKDRSSSRRFAEAILEAVQE